MRHKQVWRCRGCGHEFYTNLLKKQSLVRRMFGRKEAIKCPICTEVKAVRKRVVDFKD